MNTAEIPSQTLNEAYNAIAERREVSPAALDRQTVDEPEFLAALAYVLGIPLVEKADLTQALLADCGKFAAELETAALMEYKFVPLARRGETLVVISSSPWDPITTEVLLGYFQQCPQIKFALASPQCLQELFDYLKQA
jgi:predicted RNA-binding protein